MHFTKLALLTLASATAPVSGAHHEDRHEGKRAVQCDCTSTMSTAVASKISSSLIPTTTEAITPDASSGSPAATSAIDGPPNGECSVRLPCQGDITFYEAGLGACGVTNDGSTEHIVALAHEFMGTQSNENPFCGKTVSIKYGGNVVQATVQDKCMGCVGRDIDLSRSAFNALGIAESVGRTTANWWFN